MSRNIRVPVMPEPAGKIVYSGHDWISSHDAFSEDQIAARDAQWLEMYSMLLDELRDAATSLETISKSAGKPWCLDDDGNAVENYLKHPDQIRSYAASRASVARSALSAITKD